MKKRSQPYAKLKELIIHIARMSDMDERFGLTKLNKILFNADFEAYRRWGKSISEQPYFALEHGPAPKVMKNVLRRMEETDEIGLQSIDYYGEEQVRPRGLRAPDLSAFNVDEINLLFMVINRNWNKSATDMSKESHEFLGWEVARYKEDIPYSVALVGTRGPTLDEIQRGRKLQSMAEECLARNAARKTQNHHRGT
ncbi:MAG: SocA family protein [Acidobacteriales bacterium]|nr:SocA family protein [Terriglobales bacterium]